MSSLLPNAFKDLEHLVDEWAIADGHQRYVKRVSCTMDELKIFYNQMFPRGEAAIDYVDQFDYNKPLPEDAVNLLNLIYSLITVAMAVEVWKQPRVRNSANTILNRLN